MKGKGKRKKKEGTMEKINEKREIKGKYSHISPQAQVNLLRLARRKKIINIFPLRKRVKKGLKMRLMIISNTTPELRKLTK